jgi:hypothetical protein
VGLYGCVICIDHCHRGIDAPEKSGAELDTADTIDLAAGASSFEHRGCGDELVEA